MNVNVRSGLRFGMVLLAVTVGSMTAARAEESQGKRASPISGRATSRVPTASAAAARSSRATCCRWGRPRWSGR